MRTAWSVRTPEQLDELQKRYWPGQIVEYPEFIRSTNGNLADWPVRFLVLKVTDSLITCLGRDGRVHTVPLSSFLPMPVREGR